VVNQADGSTRANVTEFARGSSTPFATLTIGLNSPSTVAVDPRGTVYVNQVEELEGEPHDVVLVYPKGAQVPSRSITLPDGGYDLQPGEMAFDGSGNLLVAFSVNVDTAHVFTISPGASQGADLGLQNPQGNGLTIDAAGNLYAGGGGAGVSVYAPGTTVPFRTMTAPFFAYFMTAAPDGALYVAGDTETALVGEFAPGADTPTNIVAIPPNPAAVLVTDVVLGPA